MAVERRLHKRKKFGYYMRVLDNATSELVGYLTDISSQGFKLDCPRPIPQNVDITLRIELTPDVSDRSFIIFTAQAKWSKPDSLDPFTTVHGFQVVNISPHDEEIFHRMFERYGAVEKNW